MSEEIVSKVKVLDSGKSAVYFKKWQILKEYAL